jgi:hypothetical protein
MASGQASGDDVLELQEHAEGCAECRSLCRDFEEIAQAIAVSDSRSAPRCNVPEGMTERFIARARSEGVPVSRIEVDNRLIKIQSLRRLVFYPAVAAIVLALVAFVFWMLARKQHTGLKALVPHSALKSPIKKAPTVGIAANSSVPDQNSNLEEQLSAAQAESRFLVAQLKESRQALESAERKQSDISARLDAIQNDDARLRDSDRDADKKIAELRGQVEWLSSQKASAMFATEAQRKRLETLQSKVEELTSELAEAQQLNSAANQAKDMIVARNLHIIDVHDNANSSKPRPFGRIFYTEGQKLVFYAYDLGDPTKLNAKVSFYVWGEKTGIAQVKNLGILRADDERDGRWVVTFDDARVLAQINTVFVTAESNKKSVSKPNSNRILVAFIDGEANHP